MRQGRVGDGPALDVRDRHGVRPPTTGTAPLDDLIGGVRVGDNLVVVSTSPAALAMVGRAYVAAVEDPRRLVIAATETRAVDVAPGAAVVLDRRDAAFDGAGLAADLDAADERVGRGAAFLVDSLSGIQARCGADAALDLFLTLCPRLYRRGSVALWLLDEGRHDRAFLERIREITQVVVRFDTHAGGWEAEVLAAAGRSPSTIGRRQRFRGDDAGRLVPVGSVTAGRERLGELVRAQRLSRGMSQAELARQVGITPSALSQVERGVRGLAAETLIRIWEALGVPFGPEDTAPRGYRVARRGGHRDVALAGGITGRLLYDEPRAGRCWEVMVGPGATSRHPLFSGKATEAVVLERGVLELRVDGRAETLHEGDSLVAPEAVIDGCHNPGPVAAVAVWVVLP